jgi:hypothetical protein
LEDLLVVDVAPGYVFLVLGVVPVLEGQSLCDPVQDTHVRQRRQVVGVHLFLERAVRVWNDLLEPLSLLLLVDLVHAIVSTFGNSHLRFDVQGGVGRRRRIVESFGHDLRHSGTTGVLRHSGLFAVAVDLVSIFGYVRILDGDVRGCGLLLGDRFDYEVLEDLSVVEEIVGEVESARELVAIGLGVLDLGAISRTLYLEHIFVQIVVSLHFPQDSLVGQLEIT